MLFGNADIETAIRIYVDKFVQPGSRRHGCRDGDNLLIVCSLLDQSVGKNLGIAGRIWSRLGLGSGNNIEFRHTVIFIAGRLGRCIALALLGNDMNENRALAVVTHIAQHRQQMIKIVPVYWPYVVEPQFFKQCAARDIATCMFHRAGDGPVDCLAQIGRQLLAHLPHAHIGSSGGEARQIGAHGAGRLGDRHVIVVQNDDQPCIQCAGIVQCFIGHAC